MRKPDYSAFRLCWLWRRVCVSGFRLGKVPDVFHGCSVAFTLHKDCGMSRFGYALLMVSAVLVAACDKGVTSPPVVESRTTLSADTVRLVAIGDSARVTASSNGVSTASVSYAVAAESRFLHDLPVLSVEALAAGRLVAGAPGRVTLNVSAFNNPHIPLVVIVEPSAPLVMSHSIEGDGRIRMRGFRLNSIPSSSMTVGGEAVAIVQADSANLTVEVPAFNSTACAGASRTELHFEGAVVASPIHVTRQRQGELHLSPGQDVRLTAEQVSCLRLPAVAGSQYAIAFFDPRLMDAARTGPEGPRSGEVEYTVRDWSAGTASHAIARAAAPLRAQHLRSTSAHESAASFQQASSSCPPSQLYCRAVPWTEGERFQTRHADTGETVWAVVHKIYDGRWVFSYYEDDRPVGLEAGLAQVDSAMGYMVREGFSLIRGVFGHDPVTSPGSGQFMFTLLDSPSSNGGGNLWRTNSAWSGVRNMTFLNLGPNGWSSYIRALQLLAHEATHAYQAEYLYRSSSASDRHLLLQTRWSGEGGADIVAYEVVRRALDITLTANFDWVASTGTDGSVYGALASSARGGLADGYIQTAAFLHDILVQQVQRGASEHDALRAVALGASEGWFGYDPKGWKRTGLTERVRRSLGSSWDPVDAAIRYAVRVVLDEAPVGPESQIPAFRNAQGVYGHAGGFRPRAAIAGGQGGTTVVSQSHGGVGYVLLDDDGIGGSYSLSASEPGAVWSLTRIR
jgi:hypothetical protein